MTTAREYAERITAAYDSANQFAAVATNGVGEWEIDRASEFAAQSDEVTVDDIVSEIESICREKSE